MPPVPVTLHIYDVSTDPQITDVNKILSVVGTGAFHGGVEVFGKEWSYGYVDEGTGVFHGEPRSCTAHRYRESIPMGDTYLSKQDAEALLARLMDDWPGEDYDLLRRNCVLFCKEFVQKLGAGPVPYWVTNLAGAGATLLDGAHVAATTAQAAAIMAAAKAGEIDAKYMAEIDLDAHTELIQAKAKELLRRAGELDEQYHLQETAADVASRAAELGLHAASVAAAKAQELDEQFRFSHSASVFVSEAAKQTSGWKSLMCFLDPFSRMCCSNLLSEHDAPDANKNDSKKFQQWDEEDIADTLNIEGGGFAANKTGGPVAPLTLSRTISRGVSTPRLVGVPLPTAPASASQVGLPRAAAAAIARENDGHPAHGSSSTAQAKQLQRSGTDSDEGGDEYTGQFCGTQRHGHGVLLRANGTRYEGMFANNVAHGEGVCNMANGGKYEGQWYEDRAHGKGKFTDINGGVYDGEWEKDVKSGQGVETFPDGSRYEGSYLASKKHGHGRYRFSNGDVHEGQFVNDRMEGQGSFKFADGRYYVGQWKRGHKSGTGRMEWPNGCSYEGGYENDLKSGEGKFVWADGRTYEGQWKNGKQHGVGLTTDAKGVTRSCQWNFGVKVPAPKN